MSNYSKRRSGVKIAVAVLAVLLVAAGVAAAVIGLCGPKTQTFTAKAETYQGFQKFSHWVDEEGNEVSKENPYSYEAEADAEYTAVYADFATLKPVFPNEEGKSYYSSSTHGVYAASSTDPYYIDVPMTKGMYVDFTVVGNFGLGSFGFITAASLENPSLDFSCLKSEVNLSLVNTNTAEDGTVTRKAQGMVPLGGGLTYGANIKNGIPYTSEELSFRVVYSDMMLVYCNGELFSAEGLDWRMGNNEYHFFVGINKTVTFTGFGYNDKAANIGNYTEETKSEPIETASLQGKKITLIGDSITAGTGASNASLRYTSLTANLAGMEENNMGVGGTTLIGRLDDFWEIPSDSDMIVCAFGCVDFSIGRTMGEFMTDDTETWYGAVNEMCRTLSGRFLFSDTKIYITSPIVWGGHEREDRNGVTLGEYDAAIKQTANYYGIGFIDIAEKSGFSEDQLTDGVHPNDAGHHALYEALMDGILANNSYLPKQTEEAA